MRDILTILKEAKALLMDDHFVYTSGLHGSIYINKDILYIHTQNASDVGNLFAHHLQNEEIDIIAAPALGGIVLSQWTAYHLSQLKKREVMAVYTEKTVDKDQIFTRGYDKVVAGKNVAVIEDLVTTGGSVRKVVDSVIKVGGSVRTVGVMIDRSPEDKAVTEEIIGAPFFALGRLPVAVYKPHACPMCQHDVPINTSVGHGKKFLKHT